MDAEKAVPTIPAKRAGKNFIVVVVLFVCVFECCIDYVALRFAAVLFCGEAKMPADCFRGKASCVEG